jgi:hypothetical protein
MQLEQLLKDYVSAFGSEDVSSSCVTYVSTLFPIMRAQCSKIENMSDMSQGSDRSPILGLEMFKLNDFYVLSLLIYLFLRLLLLLQI